jgi:hypothetical protein
MRLRGEPDLSGIRTALRIELCGEWIKFNPETAPLPREDEVESVCRQILAYRGPSDMPPDTRLLRLLVDATAALHNEDSRAVGWRMLGVRPSMGRRLLGAESNHITWVVWFTAVSFGLGYARFDSDEAYYAESGTML